MVNFRKFCISGGNFSGFETFVDLDKTENLQDIIYCVTDNLKAGLYNINLHTLNNIVDPTIYHIHDFTFENILMSESNNTFYICNHC